MSELDVRLTAIRDRIDVLDRSKLFGARFAQEVRKPVATPDEIERFEQAHHIRLPHDYRAFLMTVGNGAIGPFYGIHPLGQTTDGPWKPHVIGTLASTFPHTAPWNLPEDRLEELQNDEDDDALVEEYWRPVGGAIPIADEGCNLRDLLVVTGPEAGHVWHEGVADFDGYRPWGSGDGCVAWKAAMISARSGRIDVPGEPARVRMSFLDWYEAWLARARLVSGRAA
jgi:hypothetical protein